MQVVTAEQKAALQNPSTTRLVWVDITEPNGTIAASTEPGQGIQLYRSGGSVQVNGEAEIQRTFRGQFIDPDGTLSPSTATDLLHPLSGRRVRVRAGIRTWSRPTLEDELTYTDHLWAMGIFDLFSADIDRQGDSISISVEADDLGSRVRDNAWPEGRYKARENVNARLTWVLQQADPAADFDWAPTDVIAPNRWYGIDGRNDRLADLRALARRAAYRLIVNASGVWTTVPIVDPDDAVPVWTFDTTNAYNLTSVSRQLSRRDTYNVVVLDVQSPETPDTGEARNFRVYAKVSDPANPAWIGGPLRRRTLRESATKPMKQADAQAMVNARLRDVRRTTETVSFGGLLVPTLEAYDVVQLNDPQTGTTDNHLLEGFTFNFDSGVVDAQTSARRVRA